MVDAALLFWDTKDAIVRFAWVVVGGRVPRYGVVAEKERRAFVWAGRVVAVVVVMVMVMVMRARPRRGEVQGRMQAVFDMSQCFLVSFFCIITKTTKTRLM